MAGFRVAERRVVPRAKAAKKTQNAVVLDQIFESFRDNHRSFLGSDDRVGCARRAHTQNDLWLSLNREREGRRSTYHIATSAPAVTKVSSEVPVQRVDDGHDAVLRAARMGFAIHGGHD